MRKDRPAQLFGIAALFQNLVAHKGMLLRRGMLFVVEVVQQAGDAPFFFVLAELAGIRAHAGLYRQHVFAQTLRRGVFTHEIPGRITISHGFVPVFSFYSPVWTGITLLLYEVLG